MKSQSPSYPSSVMVCQSTRTPPTCDVVSEWGFLGFSLSLIYLVFCLSSLFPHEHLSDGRVGQAIRDIPLLEADLQSKTHSSPYSQRKEGNLIRIPGSGDSFPTHYLTVQSPRQHSRSYIQKQQIYQHLNSTVCAQKSLGFSKVSYQRPMKTEETNQSAVRENSSSSKCCDVSVEKENLKNSCMYSFRHVIMHAFVEIINDSVKLQENIKNQ